MTSKCEYKVRIDETMSCVNMNDERNMRLNKYHIINSMVNKYTQGGTLIISYCYQFYYHEVNHTI